jgi:CHASE3 domain sensor protein
MNNKIRSRNPVSAVAALLNRLPVGRQLALAFGLLLLLSLVIGGFALHSMQQESARTHALGEKWLASAGHVATLRESLLAMREQEVKHSRATDKSYHGEYEEKITASAKSVDDAIAALKPLMEGEQELGLMSKLKAGWAAYRKAADQVIKMGRGGQQTDAADISDGAASMAVEEALHPLGVFGTYVFDRARESVEVSDAAFKRGASVMAGLVAASLLIGAALATFITRALMRQLGGEPRVAAEVARAVAAGDLSSRIVVRPGDGTSLMASLDAM